MIRKALPDLGVLILLLLLPLLLFAPVALGSKTLLPADSLFLFEPYRAAAADGSAGLAEVLGVAFPHNHLVADLILENYAWKRFLVEAIHNRELPLWDPYIFAGHPFLANGQHSAFYPLSIIFYVLPLWRAYGVFAWLQLGLAGIFTYLFVRVLGIRRLGGLIAGVTFQFSGFMVVSSVAHPMVIAGASWLPFILAMVELVVQQRPALGRRPATLPWTLLGALGLGCQMLAGHAENTYFVLLITGAYALWRLISRSTNKPGLVSWLVDCRRPASWLVVMLVLGLALGAVQFVPLVEVVSSSFRGGEAAPSLQQVLGWAYPPRRLITLGIPNFFGNPAHHGYFDLFTRRWTAALAFPDGQYVYWGQKNYVEGGAYLGLLPLFLALIAVLWWLAPYASRFTSHVSRLTFHVSRTAHHAIPFFTLLSLFSLGCIFGTPLYALVYALPGFEQSHSPFRWVFPLSLSVAVLAGFGVEVLVESRKRLLNEGAGDRKQGLIRNSRSRICNLLLLGTPFSLVALFAALALWGGLVTLAGLALSRVFFAQIEPLVGRVFQSLALAPTAFSDHRAFYSYEARWVALFGLLLTGTGIVLRVSRCPIFIRRRPVWESLAVGLLVLDFVTFGAGFNPAVDPALLDYTPPVVEFLRQDTSLWRYATFTPPGTTKTMNANVGMFYGLQTVNGYDSLFTRQYADYMALIEEQDELQYNRIASFSEWSSLDSPLTDLLGVKYVITEVEIPNPAKYRLVYQDEAVRVYENLAVMPRAFILPASATVVAADVAEALRAYDPRHFVIVEARDSDSQLATYGSQPVSHNPQSAICDPQSSNEVFVDAVVSEPSWLVLADSFFPGWKGFVRPRGAGEEEEQQVEIYHVDGNFRGVLLSPGAWTVRFKYSPDSVKIGAFITFIAGMLVLFLTGLYLWRFFYREEDDASTIRRVAKNSIAPIILNLFNRTIDLAFAALMARILGPVGNGRYYTAMIIYGWFDIIANFGLDMYLMREVSRDRANARRLFVNTTILRLLLFVVVVPAMGGFLAGRQALGKPLAVETVWVVVLLYVGLLPGSVANSLTALFRGCEKNEYPAAVQTVTTIVKVTLQVLALVGGLGIVGLAGASILTNVATLAILALLARRLIWAGLPRARGRVVWHLQRTMLSESWPLMASLLLQALFTGLNGVLLQFLQGDAVVGWYDAARKWLDALNIIPSVFTFAVFPVMSRQAAQDRSGLQRSYRLSVKMLTIVALPAAVLVTLLATVLVGLLSGGKFLPHGAVVLRLLIWSILFGWINSLTNYVLIALNRQRYVLVASGARVVFTIAANLLLVRTFSYVASAWIIIGGELLLALLFYVDLRRQLGAVGWVRTLGRPVLAGLAMGAVAWAVAAYSLPLALLAGLVVYPAALLLLRVLTPEEWKVLAPLLPARLRKMALI
ncbi:MAG: oligosaccharide flippase family protein [Anaerolineae bacterium]|nr:oligosaccharide flippase family protein [Anaerolineae bacterium]